MSYLGVSLAFANTGTKLLVWKNDASLPMSHYKQMWFLTVGERTAFRNQLALVYGGLVYWEFNIF
jgi:hypothetical protein